MIGTKRIYVIMPLREGSKRVKDKAMRKIKGKPLCKWIIDEWKKSKYIDCICISTSSERYKKIVSKWGVKIIDRPEALSQDNIPLLPVMKDAIRQLGLKDSDFIIQVEPTKPLTFFQQFDYIIEQAYNQNLDSAFTVKELKANILGDEAVVSQEKKAKEKKYLYFGSVRIRTVKTLVSSKLKTWGTGEKHFDFPIVNDYEIDIDYPYQLEYARAMLRKGKKWVIKYSNAFDFKNCTSREAYK